MLPVLNSNASKEDKQHSSPNPVKKIYRISNKSLVVIDEALAVRLRINNDDSWVEQQHTENGILLVIKRF
jgi:hypothetical protein